MQDNEEQFLDALYLGVRDRDEFDHALDLLCGLFDAVSASLIDFDAARPQVSTHASVGLLSGESLLVYQRDFASTDPAPPAFMTQPAGTAISTYRLLAEETRRPGVFFEEFFRPLGLEECLGGTLASSNGRFAMIGVQRAPERKAFDDADIAKLERLMPHLWRALQLRRSFIALERRGMALAEASDRAAAGFVGLDESGRSLFINEAARRIATESDGLSLDREGRLFAHDRGANQHLAECAHDVAKGGSGGLVHVPRHGGKPAYVLMVSPLFLGEGLEPGPRRPRGTLVVIHDPLHHLPPAPQLLAAMFGLPLGAATLLATLAAGVELKDYAERAGISMNTVRFHLKTAFARTGVHRQSDLMRLVTGALRDLADHREP